MRLLMMSLAIFSLCACVHEPIRPNTYVSGLNGPDMWLEGYNLLRDYDADGNLKPDAKKNYYPFISVKDLNAALVIMPPGKIPGDEGTKGLLRWLKELKLWSKDHCK